MSLGQLALTGVVNPCSTSIWLSNQVIGAMVSITRGGASIGGSTATWGSQGFPLTTKVNAGEMLVATQSVGGGTASPPLNITVAPTPTQAEVDSGAFYQPLNVCAKCVFLSGMVPGADVIVSVNNKASGEATVDANGFVQVVLKQPLALSDSVSAVQTACKTIKGQPIAAGPVSSPFIPPIPVVEPVYACDRAIVVSHIMAGGQVTVSRGTKVLGQMWVAIPTATFLVPPLAASGPKIQAVVDFPGCKSDPGPLSSAKVNVLSQTLNPPTITATLCSGTGSITLDKLHVGALVELDIGGTVLQFTASATKQSFPVPSLTNMTVVTAKQATLCTPTVWSTPLAAATVQDSGLAQPKGFAPPNGTLNETVDPAVVLQWTYDSPCHPTDHFDVQIATDGSFNNIVGKVDNWDTPAHQWHVTPNLKHNTKYFWRVRATGNPPGNWSSPFVFTTV